MTIQQAGRAVLLTVTFGVVGASASPEDVAFLTKGVSAIDAPGGVPGPLCVFGDQAFAVVAGKSGRNDREAMVAAARHGRGRVVVFGHGGFLSPASCNTADTGTLVRNAFLWAAGAGIMPEAVPTIGVARHGGLAEYLSSHGMQAESVSLSELGRFRVFYIDSHHIASDAEADRLRGFVHEGGGLVTSGLAWGWLQLNPGKDLLKQQRGNVLLAPLGLLFADGYLKHTSAGRYGVGTASTDLLHAGRALEAAASHHDGTRKLAREQIGQVGTVLSRAAQSLPKQDTLLLPHLQRMISTQAGSIVPSPQEPVKTDNILGRLSIAMQTREAQSAPPAQVRAHPAGAIFPGAVPDDAPTVTRKLEIDTKKPGWHSTGLYAAPGALLTATVPASAAAQKLKIRIGAHRDKIWDKSEWKRMPEITRDFALRTTETQAANAFGGAVYIDVPKACNLGTVSVTVAGAVEAPHYVLGLTTLEEWCGAIRQRPAPWAELESTKAILTVPSSVVRGLDDPERLMMTWDSILDACADLATRPRQRERPERYVPDLQISAGYMHAGYPIMTHSDQYDILVDREKLLKGRWGLFHETGHNHQNRDWTFGGTGEVTVNLFTLYVFDTVCGVKPEQGRMVQDNITKQVTAYFADGPDFGAWKSKPFLALMMYVHLQQAFGWDSFKKAFAEYRDLPDSERPKSDDEKRDQWMTRLSRTVGRDLGPFFQAWGVPTSEAARTSVAALPSWLPPNFPPGVPLRED